MNPTRRLAPLPCLLLVASVAFTQQAAFAQQGSCSRASGLRDKLTKPAAYYDYSLGHLYSELAAAYGNRGEYFSKAADAYRAALESRSQRHLYRRRTLGLIHPIRPSARSGAGRRRRPQTEPQRLELAPPAGPHLHPPDRRFADQPDRSRHGEEGHRAIPENHRGRSQGRRQLDHAGPPAKGAHELHRSDGRV